MMDVSPRPGRIPRLPAIIAVFALAAPLARAEEPDRRHHLLAEANARPPYTDLHVLEAARAQASGRHVRVGILDHDFAMEDHPEIRADGVDSLDSPAAADHAAVMALLELESRLAVAGDIDGLLALYVQDDGNARLTVTDRISAMITGWDAIRRHQETLLASDWMDWQDKQFSKENAWIKVHGDAAWAVCDNVWRWRVDDQRKQFQNIQITILEKHAGRWKIAFQAFVRDPEHRDVIDIP